MQVVDHYENPRNVGTLDKTSKNVGTGLVGAPACGDVMKLQVCLSLSMDGYIYTGPFRLNYTVITQLKYTEPLYVTFLFYQVDPLSLKLFSLALL